MAERSILVRGTAGGPWLTPETDSYTNEDHLQALLAADPARIPGLSEQALTVRELSTSGGYVDVVAVDWDGELTVVECKLAANPEKRRMVLGQVIDYAAAIWADGWEAFLDGWKAKTHQDLAESLTPEAFDRLRDNIRTGRVHLCLAVDRIDDELRRLIEYLNVITGDNVTVTALQLAYAKHGDIEILIPSTYGGELAAAKTRGPSSSVVHWTWEKFFDAIADDQDRGLAQDVRRRLEASGGGAEISDLTYMGRMPGGSIFIHLHGRRVAPFSLWVNKAGRLTINGTWTTFTSVDPQRFRPVAEVLGQDVHGPATGVPLRELDLDRLWTAAEQCSLEANSEG